MKSNLYILHLKQQSSMSLFSIEITRDGSGLIVPKITLEESKFFKKTGGKAYGVNREYMNNVCHELADCIDTDAYLLFLYGKNTKHPFTLLLPDRLSICRPDIMVYRSFRKKKEAKSNLETFFRLLKDTSPLLLLPSLTGFKFANPKKIGILYHYLFKIFLNTRFVVLCPTSVLHFLEIPPPPDESNIFFYKKTDELQEKMRNPEHQIITIIAHYNREENHLDLGKNSTDRSSINHEDIIDACKDRNCILQVNACETGINNPYHAEIEGTWEKSFLATIQKACKHAITNAVFGVLDADETMLLTAWELGKLAAKSLPLEKRDYIVKMNHFILKQLM